MTHLLDTSAIIGWLERSESSLPALLRGADTAFYHPVALGELQVGIERANTDGEREMRTNNFRFTAQRLEMIDDRTLPAKKFGFLTARFGRKLSHNDVWILASAIATTGLTLATEDEKLFDFATSDVLDEAVRLRGWVRPRCRLVESSPVTSPD